MGTEECIEERRRRYEHNNLLASPLAEHRSSGEIKHGGKSKYIIFGYLKSSSSVYVKWTVRGIHIAAATTISPRSVFVGDIR